MSDLAVSVIIGSDSDLSVIQDTVKVLREFGISHELNIISAHRNPKGLSEYIKFSEKNGVKIFIGVAGGAAHLPGVIASQTVLPVIGVPIKGKSVEGIDSLLSIAQMPAGVPVATVAINGAKNAGLLAVQILALEDKALKDKLLNYKQKMKMEVERKTDLLNKIGIENYLKNLN